MRAAAQPSAAAGIVFTMTSAIVEESRRFDRARAMVMVPLYSDIRRALSLYLVFQFRRRVRHGSSISTIFLFVYITRTRLITRRFVSAGRTTQAMKMKRICRFQRFF